MYNDRVALVSSESNLARRRRARALGSDAEGAVGTLLAARDAYVTAHTARAAAQGEVRVGSLRFDTEDRVDAGCRSI